MISEFDDLKSPRKFKMVCTFSRQRSGAPSLNWLKTSPSAWEQMPLNSPPSCSTAHGSVATAMEIPMSPIKSHKAPSKPFMPRPENCGTNNSKNSTVNSVRRYDGSTFRKPQSIWSTEKTNVAMNPFGFELSICAMACEITPFQQQNFVMNCLPFGGISSRPACLGLPTPAL